MTDDEARRLATRIIDTWPTGPKAYIWRDTLIDLDATHAATAYRTCLRVATRPPAPADFLDAYTAAIPATPGRSSSTPPGTPDPDCPHCRGAGMVDGPPITHDELGRRHAHPYTTLVHCQCTSTTATTRRTPAPNGELF